MSNRISLKLTPKSVISKHAAINSPIKLLSLNDMLAKFDPRCHGGEAMAFLPIGLEVIPKI
jgi:hypothetical protein